LEATTAAEGRGTTTPFQLFGAPFINAMKFTDALNLAVKRTDKSSSLNCFREAFFEPTFSKYNGTVVNGTQFVEGRCVSDFETAVHILVTLKQQSTPSSAFVWDGSWFGHPGSILIDEYAGSADLRIMIDAGYSADDIVKHFERDEIIFRGLRQSSLLY
jgi:uncharacterized protein YbbC (DUF1343 family)